MTRPAESYRANRRKYFLGSQVAAKALVVDGSFKGEIGLNRSRRLPPVKSYAEAKELFLRGETSAESLQDP